MPPNVGKYSKGVRGNLAHSTLLALFGQCEHEPIDVKRFREAAYLSVLSFRELKHKLPRLHVVPRLSNVAHGLCNSERDTTHAKGLAVFRQRQAELAHGAIVRLARAAQPARLCFSLAPVGSQRLGCRKQPAKVLLFHPLGGQSADISDTRGVQETRRRRLVLVPLGASPFSGWLAAHNSLFKIFFLSPHKNGSVQAQENERQPPNFIYFYRSRSLLSLQYIERAGCIAALQNIKTLVFAADP